MKQKLLALLIMCMFVIGFSGHAFAMAPKAVEGVDYVITYQAFQPYATEYFTKYFAVVEVQNISSGNLYMGAGTTFDIYDSNGMVAEQIQMVCDDPNVIAPGEKSYFYPNFGSFSKIEDADGGYAMTPSLDIKKTNLPVKRNTISNTQLTKGKLSEVAVTGLVENTTDQDDALAWMCCVFFDAEDHPIGFAMKNLMGLAVGEKKAFDIDASVTTADFSKGKIARYEIFSAPMQYQY